VCPPSPLTKRASLITFAAFGIPRQQQEINIYFLRFALQDPRLRRK
jgi:hypothetical protein